MGIYRWVLAVVGASALFACNPSGQTTSPVKSPSTGEVFGGKTCHAVRNPTEPRLTAWDPDDRAQINALRGRGVVAVRYAVRGCNVELEVRKCSWRPILT